MQLDAITNHYNNYIFILSLLIINVYLEKQLGQLNYKKYLICELISIKCNDYSSKHSLSFDTRYPCYCCYACLETHPTVFVLLLA